MELGEDESRNTVRNQFQKALISRFRSFHLILLRRFLPGKARKGVGKGQNPSQGTTVSKVSLRASSAQFCRRTLDTALPCPHQSVGQGCPHSVAQAKWLWQPEGSPSAKRHWLSGVKVQCKPTSMHTAERLKAEHGSCWLQSLHCFNQGIK